MKKKILIVEDYDDTRIFMKFLLESYGYQVAEAADGREALNKFEQNHPDLILMDITLPDIDGLTATEKIRKTEEGSSVPIIAVTALGNTVYKEAIAAGCNDLIPKPLDFDSIKPVLNQYL